MERITPELRDLSMHSDALLGLQKDLTSIIDDVDYMSGLSISSVLITYSSQLRLENQLKKREMARDDAAVAELKAGYDYLSEK
jgi:hypothetical protein